MIDVGYDTGFSRDFGDSGLFGAGRPTAGTLSARTATAEPDKAQAVLDGNERVPPEPALSNGHEGDRAVPAATPVHDRSHADFAGLDLAALQALAGSGEPSAAIARQVADMAQGLAALADKLVGQPQASSADGAEADCIAFLEGQFRIRRCASAICPACRWVNRRGTSCSIWRWRIIGAAKPRSPACASPPMCRAPRRCAGSMA